MTRLATTRNAYSDLLDRLNRASVKKHFDAYDDVPWDAAECRVHPEDPRWVRTADDPLGATDWYREQPVAVQARIGLHLVATQMTMGVDFENILSRGLLEFATTRARGPAEFRYAYHEVIEEGQHSLMFREFVERTGLVVQGLRGWVRWAANRVPSLARTFPELFFIHVLAGEVPIDHVQRMELRRGDDLHPLLRRVLQIHVTEEARHVCFARRYLEERVPQLPGWQKARLRLMTPFVIRETTRQMLVPPSSFFRAHGIPRSVVAEAYGGAEFRRLACDGLAPLRETSVELGVVTPEIAPLWRALGVWPLPHARKALPSGDPRLMAE